MRRMVLIGAAIAAMTAQAEAISRYNSMNYSCREARSITAREGAVIFRYPSANNPNHTLYDRFVAHGGYCAHGEAAVPLAIPTADRAACGLLRYRQSTLDDDFWQND